MITHEYEIWECENKAVGLLDRLLFALNEGRVIDHLNSNCFQMGCWIHKHISGINNLLIITYSNNTKYHSQLVTFIRLNLL